jgi:acyl homoserine lactone synthase
MYTLSATERELPTDLNLALAAYRYRIFIERLGWPLQQRRQRQERDQFDRPDTLYVVALDADGVICGCARLLPTDQPYLLAEVFPHLLLHAPHSQQIWELTRFAADAPDVTRMLLNAVLARARQGGAHKLLTFSPLAVERLLLRHGLVAERIGTPHELDGKTVCAYSIDLNVVLRRDAA